MMANQAIVNPLSTQDNINAEIHSYPSGIRNHNPCLRANRDNYRLSANPVIGTVMRPEFKLKEILSVKCIVCQLLRISSDA
jgi:hypothetical protein